MVVKIHQFRLKLKTNFSISHGNYSFRDSIVIQFAAENHVAFGETVAIDYYGIDKKELLLQIDHVTKSLKNWDITKSENEFYLHLCEILPNKPFVHAAFDSAYWDLKARLANKSLKDYINPTTSKQVLSSITIGVNEQESILNEKLNNDWPIIKLKINGTSNQALIPRIKHANKSFGIDTNGSWNLETWNQLYPLLVQQDCLYIEQPFSKENEHLLKELKPTSNIPVLADESVTSLEQMQSKIDLYDGFVLKLIKCGGITPVLDMIHLAKANHKLLLAGCMTESSVGISNMHALLDYFDYADLDGAQLISNDSFDGASLQSNGTFHTPSRIGNGIRYIGD